MIKKWMDTSNSNTEITELNEMFQEIDALCP